MTAKVHSSTSSGDSVIGGTVGIGLSGQVHNLDETYQTEVTSARFGIQNAFDQLPAQKNAEASINFFGSSYTGVDLKVIAHLYDTPNNKDKVLEDLEKKRATAIAIVDGCTNLLTGGLDGLAQQQQSGNPLFFGDFEARKELFIAATGVDPVNPANQRAIGILVGNIFKTGNFTFLGVAQMKRQAQGLLYTYVPQETSLTDQIDNLKELDFESSSTAVLGTLQTISIQSFREKHAVRACGHSYAKGYTRGTRTIGGTMIFTIFNEHALAELIRSLSSSQNYGERDAELSTLLPDQLPPLDLTLVFANEYGSLSDFRLYGVEFVTDGSVFSIEDLLSEGTMNFVCRDADIMTSRGQVRLSRLQRGMFNDKDDKDIAGSSLLFDNNDYYEHLQRLGVRRRLTNR